MKKFAGIVCLFVGAMTASASSDQTTAEWKQLRAEKRRIAVVANDLGALARSNHLTSWESHSLVMAELRSLVNSSGKRIVKLNSMGASSAQLEEMRTNLSQVADQLSSLKMSVTDSRLATRTPAYYEGVLKLVQQAERNESAVERVVAAALASSGSTATAD